MPIVVESLSHIYNRGTSAESRALTDVSITIERGEWISIVGHTGSGKSTLAQHLNVLLLPQEGSVSIDGVLVEPKSKNLRTLRRKVGLVFQYPEQQFFAETVREEIAFAPSNWGVSGEDLEEIVADAANAVGLSADHFEASPFALSGGQRRRVALASVIAMQPDYLILDEPTAGLDAVGIKELMTLLNEICAMGLGVVQVTHDLQSALANSDRVFVLEGGRCVVFDAPEAVARVLLEKPVRGLIIPPLVRFAAGLARRGVRLPLTAAVPEILTALERGVPCPD